MIDQLQGAWQLQSGNEQQIILFQDSYFTHTSFNQNDKQFIQTDGGTYKIKGNNIEVYMEFHTLQEDSIATTIQITFDLTTEGLRLQTNNENQTWSRLDNSDAPLAGVWRITELMQNGILAPIHQTGTRKTLKILTGTRFQWTAIDPGKKEFIGAGGGNYTFQNGKYTEQIEFFSRDSTRIGASLSFDDKLEDGRWHHTGFSSKGDKIYEIWERLK